MARRSYTPQQKAEALRLYVEHGPAEASRLTGITKGTLQSWASRAGVHSVASETTRAAVEAAALKWEQRRLTMIHEMGRVAAKALAVAEAQLDNGTTSRAKDATTTMAILVDKAQLLAGAATSRTEHVGERTPQVEAEIAKVVQLRAVA